MVKFTFATWKERAEGIKNRNQFINDYYWTVKHHFSNGEKTYEEIITIVADDTGYSTRHIKRIINR